MSLQDIAMSTQEGTRAQLSSVWSRSCEAPIRDIVISPEGVVGVAAASNIYLYAGAPSFGDTHTLSLSPALLTAYDFSADGSHFLTGDSQGFVKWWEVHSGEQVAATQFPFNKDMQGCPEELKSISNIVSSSETDLVAVTAGKMLCIYGHGGLRLHSIGPLDSCIRCIQWKKANELAVNIGTAICMIHVTTEEFAPRQKYPNELKEGELKTLACSPKGTMFAAGCQTGLVQIWDLASESNEEISVFLKGLPNAATDDSSVQCLEWDSTARFLAAAGGSDVIVWDMQDTSEKEEGKDNSIVCYGHGQNAKITALSFQPKGHLLATGGDDCQVLVFDSSKFASNGVAGGLVGSLVCGKLSQSQNGTAIMALAWHPSGLILAGTMNGYVDAFEVSGAIYETPRATNGSATDVPFLIKRVDSGRRTNQQKPPGWGAESLIPSRGNDWATDKAFVRNRSASVGNVDRGNRSSGSKPKVYIGNFKQPPRAPYSENTATSGTGNWPPMMHPPGMMPWMTYPPQQMPIAFAPRPPASAAPGMDPASNPPHTPESNSSEGAPRAAHQHPQGLRRNEHPMNRSASAEQQPSLMQGGPHQYPMSYMPYPTPFPMAYPPHAFSYPFPMHPQMQTEGMHVAMPGYGPPHFGQPPINHPPKMQHPVSAKTEAGQKAGSPEVEEDLGSKSSEATNNGVNNSATPTQRSDASGFYQDGRPQPGQTLYVGNLAPAVEESLLQHYFSPYGHISNIQVIRDRETQASRGFGFVTYAHPFYAQRAMQHMDSVQIAGAFGGRKLKVSFSNRR